jgi:hypothetical protein
MIEQTSKLIPALSLVLVAFLALFNVGYFWRFGVHFLGLIRFGPKADSCGAQIERPPRGGLSSFAQVV